jgi:hypothetical protein
MVFLFGEVLGRHGEHCQTQGGQVRQALRHFQIQFFKCVKNAEFFKARYILSGYHQNKTLEARMFSLLYRYYKIISVNVIQ